ncbi:unnamed protein product [Blepharisma stoltei]|uniref:Uncharacterized protein n=1 Tax=Blepharisma stoltei TaxID=1481888 RepID=A0AAU9K6N3_9CILI|nr:unnamed protein product [Blepharisma stoltei]
MALLFFFLNCFCFCPMFLQNLQKFCKFCIFLLGFAIFLLALQFFAEPCSIFAVPKSSPEQKFFYGKKFWYINDN